MMDREEWLKWRNLGIGSSDAPIIMGVSPWSTPYKLWTEKTGLNKTKSLGNWATQRGNDLEPIARAKYEFQSGLDFPAVNMTHATELFMRASLDGYNEEAKIILEIKCPNAKDHALAVSGSVPEKYFPQLQHQLMVTGANEVHYVSYDGKESLALVVVKPDSEYIVALEASERAFWDCVTKYVEPPLTDSDCRVLTDTDILDIANEYQELDMQINELEKRKKALRLRLIGLEELSKCQRVMIGAVQVTKSFRRGTIDYNAVEELNGIDLERYRKSGAESFTITIKKAGI
jgi:putative phage-type endonuclease